MGGMWPVDLLHSSSKQSKVNKSTTAMPSAGQCSELFATRSRVPPPCSHTMTAAASDSKHSVLRQSTLIQRCHWPELHQKTNCLRKSFFQPDKSTRIMMMSVTELLLKLVAVSDWSLILIIYFNVNDTAFKSQWQFAFEAQTQAWCQGLCLTLSGRFALFGLFAVFACACALHHHLDQRMSSFLLECWKNGGNK